MRKARGLMPTLACVTYAVGVSCRIFRKALTRREGVVSASAASAASERFSAGWALT